MVPLDTATIKEMCLSLLSVDTHICTLPTLPKLKLVAESPLSPLPKFPTICWWKSLQLIFRSCSAWALGSLLLLLLTTFFCIGLLVFGFCVILSVPPPTSEASADKSLCCVLVEL